MDIVRAVPKPSYKRFKPSRTTRSEATQAVRREVHERSGGACERCDRARATELAHTARRWKSEGKPTAHDFAHLCTPCHRWADSCREGREWLETFHEEG